MKRKKDIWERADIQKDKERFLVPAGGNAVAVGVEAMGMLCGKHEGDALVCVPVLKGADDTLLNEVWPREQIKQLAQGKRLRINDKHHVSMCSPFTLKNHRDFAVGLLLFAAPDTIKKFEEQSYKWKALVVVPWGPTDTQAWEKKYAPKVLPQVK